MIYLALRGLSKEVALMNCQKLKLKVPSNQSGIYWIDPHSVSMITDSRPTTINRQTAGSEHQFGAAPSQLSEVPQTLSRSVQAGQPVALTFECLQQFTE